jgi:hypothetical protein
VLIVATLDHGSAAGMYLLHRAIEWLASDGAFSAVRPELSIATLAAWAIDAHEPRA